MIDASFENIAVSTRVRLARNFADYPFPNRLQDKESATEIVKMLFAQLRNVENFTLYHMDDVADETAEFLKERNLISQDLIENRNFSAALVSADKKISVMINEEDHVREQYFLEGFDLRRAHERISGIDELISETIPFAFDAELGYLTACPTNLGTGLRASVMLFLPALTRLGQIRTIYAELKNSGLTMRGSFGEGSEAEGEMYQVSNERTLGLTEEEILDSVERCVKSFAVKELKAREQLMKQGGRAFADNILRAYGALTNCIRLDSREFMKLMTEVKLGVVCGILDGNLQQLDSLLVDMRPANLNRLNGSALGPEDRNFYRAEYVGKALRGMELLTEGKRNALFQGGNKW